VDHALVAAPAPELLPAGAAFQVLGVGLAEGDVAGGVLVKEGVKEDEAGLGDRVVCGYQGHLPQAPRPLVGFQELLEDFFPLLGAHLHGHAPFKPGPKAFHQLAGEGQGAACAHHPLHPLPVGGGEDLLRGQVGVAKPPLLGGGGPTLPEVPLGQAHGEVGAGA
jgi:hypothetical protein